MFKPKKGLFSTTDNYEDTLENFLKIRPRTRTEADDRHLGKKCEKILTTTPKRVKK